MTDSDIKHIERQLLDALGVPRRFHKPLLPKEPTVQDLLPFSTVCLRKKRMRKKFLHLPLNRLKVYLPKRVWSAYVGARLIAPIHRKMREDGFARKIFLVEPVLDGPLPEGIVKDE